MRQRASVVLPLPDSPTIPSIAVPATRERDVVDRGQLGGAAPRASRLGDRAPQLEPLHEVATTSSRLRAHVGVAANGHAGDVAVGRPRSGSIVDLGARRRGASGQRGWNGQPGGQRAQVRRLAADLAQPAARAGVRRIAGSASAARPCTGCRGVAEERSRRRVLDDVAGVHDRDAVAVLGDDAEVVRDEIIAIPTRR